MTDALMRHALRDLPRYTSYPTAAHFSEQVNEPIARLWASGVDPSDPISIYVHVPFCEKLCWYCGCHTSVPNGYDRVAALARRLETEIGLWAEALDEHGGAAHIHFGGGSPNALSPEDFERIARRLRSVFRLRPDAEFAVELDPRTLRPDFIEALGRAGVNRASLGVQTFDQIVQSKINRHQPYEQVAEAVRHLRAVGVKAINFDLMYGLPAQTEANITDTVEQAVTLRPDRIAMFGYAHVPWFAKHQKMIKDEDLADSAGRWAQATAADEALLAAGYVRVGLDHYALPTDSMALAAHTGGLRRNFQGYTTDPARTVIGIGPSSIGAFEQGLVQNTKALDRWNAAIDQGRLPVERGLILTHDDRIRAAAIERIMCDLTVDVAAICARFNAEPDALDDGLNQARLLAAEGLCRVDGTRITVSPAGRRLVRVVASVFDASLTNTPGRHAKAV